MPQFGHIDDIVQTLLDEALPARVTRRARVRVLSFDESLPVGDAVSVALTVHGTTPLFASKRLVETRWQLLDASGRCALRLAIDVILDRTPRAPSASDDDLLSLHAAEDPADFAISQIPV